MPPLHAPPQALTTWQEQVDEYVAELIHSHQPQWHKDGKIIRDAVFEYQWFHAHEITLIDTPLLQRLRYIHQTALAYLVYPSARHSRFEHSLGVAILAGRIAQTLGSTTGQPPPSLEDLYEVRLAGLLHDCGHGIFSHLSERIMSDRFSANLRVIKSSGYFRKGSSIKLAEILSFLIVQSSPLQVLWDKINAHYRLRIDLKKIAWFIVGEAPTLEQYKADIISGPFDADKLDYFTRDAHFTGVKVEVDIDRVLRTAKVFYDPSAPRRLIMTRAGVPHLEQILLSKMTLYSSIYHHHKVRATECMIRAIFETIWEDPSAISDQTLRCHNVTDFLRLRECEFFVRALDEPRLTEQMNNVLQRRVLKRALILDSTTMHAPGVGPLENRAIEACQKFQSLAEESSPETIADLRQAIFSSLPADAQTSIRELWVDLPASPALGDDAKQCLIEKKRGADLVTLRDFFPSDQWVAAYADNKWAGHIFYIPDEDKRRIAGKTAMEVLSSLYRREIEFDDDASGNCFK